MDHLPFLSNPTNFPRWPDRDQVADWIEGYSKIMRLNILSSTTVKKAEWSKTTRQYSVALDVGGKQRTLKARHIVLATGLFTGKPVDLGVPGRESFKGHAYHSSQHKSAGQLPDIRSKKVTIVGCSASAHDIAQDFVNHGAKSVAMVQRNPIFAVSTDSLEKFQANLWNTQGVSCEDADLLGNSMPTAVLLSIGPGLSQMMSQNDEALLGGLEKAGMAIRRGDTDGISILDHQMVLAGHFYIDQGASQMIVDGRIKMHRCAQGVKEYSSKGVVLADQREIESDVIVIATGFERHDSTVEEIFGNEVGQEYKKWGFMDDETERTGVST
jgi:cation diffusion facilitator CzcD-associated flavoprotein CzcO